MKSVAGATGCRGRRGHLPGGLGGLLVVVRQTGVGVEVPGPRVSVDLHVGARLPHLEIPGAQPVVGLEGVRLRDVQLDRQVVHRGVRRDVGRAVQEQQPAGLAVAEREGLGGRRAEREPRVHDPPVRVRSRGQDRALQQLLLAELVLEGPALLDGLEGAPLEEIGRPHLVSRRAQPVRRVAHRGPQPVGRMEEHDVHEPMVPAATDNARAGRDRVTTTDDGAETTCS